MQQAQDSNAPALGQKLTPVSEWIYFPKFALQYFAWTALVLFAILLVVDRIVLPQLELKGVITGEAWRQQFTDTIQFMAERNKASDENPIWRSDSFPGERTCPVTKRILVLGDSFVWGHGEANINHSWWRQLEAELKRRGHNNVQVIAAAMRGANTAVELRWARELASEYKPDAIIWSYVLNDPAELDYRTHKLIVPHMYDHPFVPGKPKYSGIQAALQLCFPNLFYQLMSRRTENYSRKMSNPETGLEWEAWELKILEGRNWEQYKNTIAQVSQYFQESKIPNFFVMLVMPNEPRFRPRLQPVEALFKQNKIPYLNPLDDMVTWYKKKFPNSPSQPDFVLGVNPVDNHAGALANHFYAVKTADLLERQYKDCLGQPIPIGGLTITLNDEYREDHLIPEINDWVPYDISCKKTGPSSYSFEHPAEGKAIMTMPLRRPFVQFNLAEASNKISRVEISGVNLSACSLAFGTEDPISHEYQVGNDLDLGERRGSQLTFDIPEDKEICEIKLSPKFSGNNRNVKFKLIAKEQQ